MERDLLKDAAVLTTLGPQLMGKISETFEYCISDYVGDARQEDSDLLEIDLGFGKLILLLLEDSIRYKFEPTKSLEKKIVAAYNGEESPIYSHLGKRLLKRLETAYKDIF